MLREEKGLDVALAACDVYRPAAVEQLVTIGQQAGATVYERGTDMDPVEIAKWARDQAVADGRDVLIVDTSGRLHVDERADGRSSSDIKKERQAPRRAAGRRRDDRPGRGQRRRAVRRAVRLRRRRDEQARRRRPRRRRAVGQGRHRQADPVRLDGREARRVRALPSRSHGPADPRDGRRADASSRRPSSRSTRTRRRELERKLRKAEFRLDDFLDQLQHGPQDGAAREPARDDPGARRPRSSRA